jgi:hypothetical protein
MGTMDKLRLMNNIELVSMLEIQTTTEALDKARLCEITINDGGVAKQIKEFKAVYNVSRGRMAASVGKGYHLILHKEYFDTFCTALNNLGIKYKAVINQSTSMAIMDIIFENKNIKFDELGEEFTTGIRIINSYTKTRGLSICPRYTRLACTNGMILTRFDVTFSVRHNSTMLKDMEHLIETRINAIIDKDEELKAWVTDSMADSIEWTMAVNIFKKLISSAKHREGILKELGIAVVTKKEKGKKKETSYMFDGTNKKLSRWVIYNAVTRFCTHGEQITPNVEAYLQKQAEKILTTKLIELPAEVVV